MKMIGAILIGVFLVTVIVLKVWPDKVKIKNVVDAVTPCSDSVDSAVLDILYPRFNRTPNYLDVWIGRYSITTKTLDEHGRKIQETLDWSKTLPDPCVRKAYAHWLNYYRGELDSAYDELRTHATGKEQDAYNKRNKKEDEATQKYREAHPVPEPPR